jgi:hypothetical protein
MATTIFTLENGGTVSGESDGTVWQGHSLVSTASVEVGDSIGVGCGFPVVKVTAKETV